MKHLQTAFTCDFCETDVSITVITAVTSDTEGYTVLSDEENDKLESNIHLCTDCILAVENYIKTKRKHTHAND